MKNKILFDTTDANTRSDTDQVGAVLYDSVNDRLAVINASQQLEVHDTDVLAKLNSGVTVTATQLDIDDLAQGTDSVAIGDGTTLFSGGNGTADDITPTHGIDSRSFGYAYDGTNWDRLRATGGALHVDIQDASITVDDVALANASIASGATALTTANTAQDVVASPLASRKYLFIANNDNRAMYIGQSGVSAATGFPVHPGSAIEMRAGASVDIEFVSAKATHDLRYLELS